MMNTGQVSPELERHSRKCSICRHPDRDAIEDEFLHWHRVIWIAQEFHIADHRSIYRHARAVGLIKARRENLHSALDNIVEQSDGIRASAGDVLRAIRAYSCLDPSTGRWTEPRKEVAMTYSIEPQRGMPATGPGNANLPIGGGEAPAAEPASAAEAVAPYDDDPTDPSSPNYIAQGPPPPDYIDPPRASAPLIGPPVIRIPANSLKIKGGRMA